jgi:hypothetical protein
VEEVGTFSVQRLESSLLGSQYTQRGSFYSESSQNCITQGVGPEFKPQYQKKKNLIST